jgi:drug/metabolite transporter (DMT)-like permease
MSELRTARIGYGSVVLAALLWALSGNAAKVLFLQGVSPFHLVQLRTTIAATFLVAALFLFRRDLLKISRKDIPYFVLLGVVLAAVQFTYLYTISKIPVAAAILIQYQSPALIALHAHFVRKRSLSLLAVAAIAGAIAGCYLMAGAYNVKLFSLNREGIVFGLASAAVFAVYTVKSEEGMRIYSGWTLLLYALLGAAIVWNVLLPPFGAFVAGYNILSWGYILYIGIFGTILPFGLYHAGIRAIEATQASVTATLEPVFAGILAYALFGEVLEPLQLAGACLVMASIILLQVRHLRCSLKPLLKMFKGG